MKIDDNDKPTGILYDIDTYKQAKTNPKIRMLPVGTVKTNPDGTNYIGQLAENEDHQLIPHGKGLHRSLPSSKYVNVVRS